MNITLPNYFRLVDFQNRSTKEQIKHLLFFVTVVAELRKDMTARIITHRLNDQGVQVSQGEVADILARDSRNFTRSPYTDMRDRSSSEIPYRIADPEKNAMIKDVNLRFARMSSWKKPINIFLGLVIVACVATLLAVIAYHLSTPSGVDDLSWTQYKQRLHIEKKSVEERAEYLLYFITEHIKFREDMTPGVISERLADANLGNVSPSAIEQYLRSHGDAVMPSANRPGAHRIAPEEAKRIFSLLGLKLPGEGDSLSLAWIAGHIHVSGIAALVSGLVSPLGVFLAIGYLIGRLSKLSTDLLLQETSG